MSSTPRWEAVIGLEVHAQLLTSSKMFCSCPAQYLGKPPNSNTCPVCLGLPGTLPVMNREAVRLTLLTALALNCEIPEFTRFDRKNYFYPDLPKGYQISQYDLPLSVRGWLEFETKEGGHRAGVTRVHLEEDTGTLHHSGEIQSSPFSLVDLNRAGVPLMEIVGEPDLRTSSEARAYLTTLRQTLVYIGVNDGNMEEGSLRCDANISLRPKGEEALGVKVEIKNMNSFRSLQRALDFESHRQRDLLESGGRVVQETRGWSELEQRTVSQRSKEEAQEYRYFPEPDLPPLVISRTEVEEVRQALPELPRARRERFITQYRLAPEPARLLTERRAEADYFEALVAAGAEAGLAAKWQLGELQGLCNAASLTVERCPVSASDLAALLKELAGEALTAKVAKEALAQAFASGRPPLELLQGEDHRQVDDQAELERWIAEAIAEQSKAAADFRAGNERALDRLKGTVMGKSRGRANPRLVDRLLRERLAESPG
ncbi:MAG: Asp-tRNA(Asn)/Glu-tRNA(Gln) amidotransferase subunit GatB [Candidatus Dormibacteria bacterium]